MGSWGRDLGSKRVVKAALACAAMSVALAVPQRAQATSTRVYTLGVMNRFIIDDANKWLYPQVITKYGNLFYVEMFGTGPSRSFTAPGSERGGAGGSAPGMLAGTDLQSYDLADAVPVMQTAGGGAIIKLTDDLFVSAHLSDYENQAVPSLLGLLNGSAAGDVNAFPWLPEGPDAPGSANRKFDLFFAYNLQDVARFGLKITYGSSKYIRNPNDNDPDVAADNQGGFEARKTDEIGTSELGFDLGAGFDIGDVAAIDAGLGLALHGLTYLPNQRELIDGGGGIEMRADVRAMVGVTEWWELVPALSFRYMSMTAADLANYGNGLVYNNETGRENYFITDVKMDQILFDLGAAGHFRPTDFIDFWAAAGLQFGQWSAQFDNTIDEDPNNGFARDQALEFSRDSLSFDAVPYVRFAIEARVFSWLDFRGGVVKYLRADTITEDKFDENVADNNRLNDVTRDYPFFDYFLGAAVHYEGLFLDFQMDPAFFQRGPNAISGASGNMFVNASLGYRF